MKLKVIFFFILSFYSLKAQKGLITTEGEKSPAIIAKSFSVQYGVRVDAITEIISIYEKEGYNSYQRISATETILKKYAKIPEKNTRKSKLSSKSLNELDIQNNPKITRALDWDLFSSSYYISTSGNSSPAIISQGDVKIWYGIPEKVLRSLAFHLEKNEKNTNLFELRLIEQVKKYEELKAELATYSSKEKIYFDAKKLIEEGQLEEAEKLIESDYYNAKKRQAFKGYMFGITKELLMKYSEAAEGYKDAILLDNSNSTYQILYGNIERTLGHYDSALKHYEIALNIDKLIKGNEERLSTLYNNIGLALDDKGQYDKAIENYQKALDIIESSIKENKLYNPAINNNLGSVWISKGNYNKAISYYEKALKLIISKEGEICKNAARTYGNLGAAWNSKGVYDTAINYYEKALKTEKLISGENNPSSSTILGNIALAWNSKGNFIKAMEYNEMALQYDLKIYGGEHPKVGLDYSNIGIAYYAKNEYDKSIIYFEKTLQIRIANFGENHPSTSTTYNNLGLAWSSKGDLDKAIEYFNKSLGICNKIFGEKHPNTAAALNSMGLALLYKEDYDRALSFFEKSLNVNLLVLGENHQDVAKDYSGLGSVWFSKGDYKKAIDYHEKALNISRKNLGENNPNTAIIFDNLGYTWSFLKNYEKAIEYYQKSQRVKIDYFGKTHFNTITVAKNLSKSIENRGFELIRDEKYDESINCFQIGVKNAEILGDSLKSIAFMNNIATVYMYLRKYYESLLILENEIIRAVTLKQTQESIKRKHFLLYSKLICYRALRRDNEANILAKDLWNKCNNNKDLDILESIKKIGYDF